jgi:eukaryotic-like serine/threonine-protein kinase
MLGDSVRRRQPKRAPRKAPKPRDGSRSWRRLLPLAAAAVAIPFVVGYVLAAYVLFPPTPASSSGIDVPALVGLRVADAERAVVSATLAGIEVAELPHPDATPGTVIAQSPLPGQQLRTGAMVRVAVSSGRPRGVVPDVVGFGDERAFALLTRLGFDVDQRRETAEAPIGRVLRIEPQPGTARDLPATVVLIVSDGPPLPDPVETPPDTTGGGPGVGAAGAGTR